MTLNGVMALFCVISANSGSFRAHCVKVHVRYLISWRVLSQFSVIVRRTESTGEWSVGVCVEELCGWAWVWRRQWAGCYLVTVGRLQQLAPSASASALSV